MIKNNYKIHFKKWKKVIVYKTPLINNLNLINSTKHKNKIICIKWMENSIMAPLKDKNKLWIIQNNPQIVNFRSKKKN